MPCPEPGPLYEARCADSVKSLEYTSSVCETLAHIASAYPDTMLLALGQTVFWDEPVKAVLRKALDDHGISMTMVLGVHDTDYFSKLPGHVFAGEETGYKVLPHNEGSTKGLWSAAGEVSQLFGSETVITRERYKEHGVSLDKVARDYPAGLEALVERKTEAWGWRGLAAMRDDPRIAGDIPLTEVGQAVEELLRWGMENTLTCLPCPNQRAAAEDFVRQMLDWVARFREQNPDAKLRDLYLDGLRLLYERLLGYEPSNVKECATSRILSLGPETAHLPRFQLLDLFIRPETRAICEKAYDQALEGSGMYSLERFGPGALPFDLVLPDLGRGTLRITDRYVVVMTPKPRFFSLKKPVRSVEDLARWIVDVFGRPLPVVGKAVSLVAMLSTEFLFVFHEEGSPYVSRTRRMNDLLRASGVELHQNPILRIRYHTWDSLSATQTWLRLPEHLACAFGQDEIQGPAFAQRWKAVVEEQRSLLSALSKAHRPIELVELLRARCRGRWDVLQQEYETLHAEAKLLEQRDQQSKSRIAELFDALRQARREYADTERLKGEDFRKRLKPLLDRQAAGERLEGEIEAETSRRVAEFDVRLSLLRERVSSLRKAISEERARRRAFFSAPEAKAGREARRAIEREAELARLRMVRCAILTVDGLTHTNHRPTAWWIPMLSPNGAWFRRIAETAEMYLEPLHS